MTAQKKTPNQAKKYSENLVLGETSYRSLAIVLGATGNKHPAIVH